MRRKTTIERFMAKIEVLPSGCWQWTGSMWGRKYVQFWVDKRHVYIHRWAYEYFIGPIPDGLTLDHLCRNTRCANPWHVEPVTNKENGLRGNSKPAINARKTHCVHGHPFNEANTRIRANGYRQCNECQRLRNRAMWLANQRKDDAA